MITFFTANILFMINTVQVRKTLSLNRKMAKHRVSLSNLIWCVNRYDNVRALLGFEINNT